MGLPATMTAFAFIGVAVTSATIVIYGEAIWDPVALIARIGNPLVIIFGALVVLVAQLTTNMAANVVSPANDFSSMAPRRISYVTGGAVPAPRGPPGRSRCASPGPSRRPGGWAGPRGGWSPPASPTGSPLHSARSSGNRPSSADPRSRGATPTAARSGPVASPGTRHHNQAAESSGGWAIRPVGYTIAPATAPIPIAASTAMATRRRRDTKRVINTSLGRGS